MQCKHTHALARTHAHVTNIKQTLGVQYSREITVNLSMNFTARPSIKRDKFDNSREFLKKHTCGIMNTKNVVNCSVDAII